MVGTDNPDDRGIYKVECYFGKSKIQIERFIIIHINKIITRDTDKLNIVEILRNIYKQVENEKEKAPNKIRVPFCFYYTFMLPIIMINIKKVICLQVGQVGPILNL
jgi:hypothetical protein